jgi:hypothetical protein
MCIMKWNVESKGMLRKINISEQDMDIYAVSMNIFTWDGIQMVDLVTC